MIEGRGVVVSAQPAEGRSLPVVRGVTTIDATPYEIMAVIRDVEGHTEWMHDCLEARLLRSEGERVAFVYNRTDAPWPVADRDSVLRTEFQVLEPGVLLRMRSASIDAPAEPPPADVVRMKRLDVVYTLRAVEPGKTEVEYQIDADPAGNLPPFLVRRTTREIPLHTLANLRERVVATRGRYDAWLDRWDPARGGSEGGGQ